MFLHKYNYGSGAHWNRLSEATVVGSEEITNNSRYLLWSNGKD